MEKSSKHPQVLRLRRPHERGLLAQMKASLLLRWRSRSLLRCAARGRGRRLRPRRRRAGRRACPQKQQHQGADDGDDPGDADAGQLVEDLVPVAVDGADRSVLAEDGIDDAGGEDAGEDGSQSSAGAMHAEGIQRVVVAEEALDDEDHEEAEEAGDQADGESRHGLHKAGGGGDGDQSGNRAGDGAQGGGLAVVNPLGDGPADGGGGGGEVGVDEGAGGQAAGGQALSRR